MRLAIAFALTMLAAGADKPLEMPLTETQKLKLENAILKVQANENQHQTLLKTYQDLYAGICMDAKIPLTECKLAADMSKVVQETAPAAPAVVKK